MRTWLLPIILVVEFLLFSWIGSNEERGLKEWIAYLQSYGHDLLLQSAPLLLLGFGMTLVMMTGGIDLSIGSSTALIACVMASFPVENFWWTAVPVGLLTGLALGSMNGLW